MRAPASALYAFCRVADDAIDTCDQPAIALEHLRRRLDAIYAGAPGPEIADRALAAVVVDKRLPRELLDALPEADRAEAHSAACELADALRGFLTGMQRQAGLLN